MSLLKMRVGALTKTEDGFKIDMNPAVNDNFHKVEGGLTIFTKDQDIAGIFDKEEHISALFLQPRGTQETIDEQSEDSGKPPFIKNDDGSITIDGKVFILESDSKNRVYLEQQRYADLQKELEKLKSTKIPPNQLLETSEDSAHSYTEGSDKAESFKAGEVLENKMNESNSNQPDTKLESPGPDTQKE